MIGPGRSRTDARSALCTQGQSVSTESKESEVRRRSHFTEGKGDEPAERMKSLVWKKEESVVSKSQFTVGEDCN